MKKIIPSGIFFFISLWFWCFLSPNTLHFLETTQFFPYTWSHLRDAVVIPGGIAGYVSEFFVQFFLFALPASIIVTIALCLLQILTWKLACLFKPQETASLYGLSFIVPFCAWAYLCVFGNMFSGIVALAGVLFAAYLFLKKERPVWASVLSVFLVYWLCGPLAWVYLLIILLFTIIRKRKIIPALAALVTWAILPFIWHLLIQYTIKELYLGTEYFHEPQKWPLTYWIMAASPVFVCLLQALLPQIHKGKAAKLLYAGIIILVFVLGWFGMIKSCNPAFERIFKYDKMALNQDWDGILQKAKQIPPQSLAEATSVNLALAMKNRLLTDLFLYPQPGPTALFPDYASGYVVTLTAGESVFRAGLINTARHYAFEEYESYPNFRVSARHMKRVAETDLISGRYTLARRFLKELSHTLFYRKWAKTYLSDPQKVSEDKEYSRLMQYCDSTEFLYSDSSDDDKREMLRNIVARDGRCSVPMEYLFAYDLLARDLFSLRVHLNFVDFNGDVPPLVQQAVAMFDGAFFDVAPFEKALVSEEVRQQYSEFQTALIQGQSGNEIKKRFGKTYWYYFSLN